jgi:hypothetical protein
VSSEPLIQEDLDSMIEPDDPLAELEGPSEFDGEFEVPDEFDALTGADDGYEPELASLMEGDSDPVLLVWPRDDYEQVDQRWPEVLEPIGADCWDDYRRLYQALLTRWTRRGLPSLSMVTGSADGFADWLSEQGADPMSVDLVAMAEGYGQHLADQVGAVELPPAGTDPCWCGSGVSYGGCCQPLSPP